MDGSTITCPKCRAEFALTAAIARPIEQRVRAEVEASVAAETAKREAEIKAREEKLTRAAAEVEKTLAEERKKIAAEQEVRAKEAVAVKMRDLHKQVEERGQKLREAQASQLEVIRQKRELEEQRQQFELEKAKQIEAERSKIREEATKAAVEGAAAQMRELQGKLEVKDRKLVEAQEAELKLRKEKAEFEEQKRAFELEVARREDVARDLVRKEKDEEYRLKEAEKNRQMEDLKRQIDDLKRKAEQGSQQAQGEVLEVDLEAALRRCFPQDEVSEVAKGVHGGDVIQQVRDEAGRLCGTIIWESKRTKLWSEGWLGKLKDDKLAAKAQVAVLVSVAMPKDVPSFECRENVWVTPPALAVPLGAVLRTGLIDTAAARRAEEGRHGKVEAVYDYVTGPEFKARVQAILDTFIGLKEELEEEKRAFGRRWAKREKLIERVIGNTAELHGEVAGIVGRDLPGIERLQLEAVGEETGDEVGDGGGRLGVMVPAGRLRIKP